MVDKQRLGAFVLGGLAGALAGILFAPKSGREFRGSIASRAGEARERSRETYFEAQERWQERIAEVRERSPRQGETYAEEGAAAEPLASKFAPDTPEPEPGPPIDMPAGTTPDPPPLRDASRDVPLTLVGEDPNPEEIRRRIQETRLRLRRGRLDTPEPEDVTDEGRDG